LLAGASAITLAKKMNLSDEAALVLMAAEHATIDQASIVKWVDDKIAQCDIPTDWMIELSTLKSNRLVDYVSVLRHKASSELYDTEHRMMAIIDAHAAGALTLDASISALWKVWSGTRNLYDTDNFPDDFADGLVAWDCLEDISVIPPSLVHRFELLFQEFRTAHPNVTSYYRHQSNKNGQRDMTTTTSRPVSMIFRNYNTKPVIDVRRRW